MRLRYLLLGLLTTGLLAAGCRQLPNPPGPPPTPPGVDAQP
jgi:hypothetical protein